MITSVLKVIQGWVKLRGGSDGTFIGNVGDRLSVDSFARDFFGNGVISQIYNKVEVPLDNALWTDFVNTTTANGGDATQASGQVSFNTQTNADGRYAAISKDAVIYRANNEVGYGFTWRIPTPSISGVTLRIGATDNITTWANSIYFSHDNGNFNLVYRRNNSTIFSVQQSSWLDKCDGSAGSLYVNSAGTPVALDTAKDQLARIHCGLFGHAGFTVEVLAPNQKWVTIYKHTNINDATVAVFGNFDLSVGVEVKKVAAGAVNYSLVSACWAGWTGSPYQRVNESVSDRSLASLMKSVIIGKSSAGGGTFVDVKVTPSGSLTTDTTISDVTAIVGQQTSANSIPVVIASDQSLNLTADQVDYVPVLKDAFNRLRVSNPENVTEITFFRDQINTTANPDGKMFESEVNGATGAYNVNTRSYDMAVTSTLNSEIIVQSAEYYHYVAGKSQLIKLTGNFNGGVAGVNKYYGLFDAANGIYFTLQGTTPGVGVRSSTSGSVVNTIINQSSWNIDKLDGTGASGKTLDFTKQLFMFFDYGWQGTAPIRFGFLIDGGFYYCHRYDTSNVLTVPWAQTGTLPIRAQMINTAAAASTMSITCMVIESEGGYNLEGELATMNQGSGTGKSYTTAGSRIPLISMRKSTAGIKVPVEILDAGLFANSADDFLLEFVINGTLTGASWSGTGATTYTERDVASTAITGGKVIYSTYVRGNTNANSVSINNFRNLSRDLFLGTNVAGVSEIVSVVATNITANANANGFINFKEYI